MGIIDKDYIVKWWMYPVLWIFGYKQVLRNHEGKLVVYHFREKMYITHWEAWD